MLTEEQKRTARIIGHVFASMSLVICLVFLIDFFYSSAAEEPLLKFTGFQWFKTMIAAFALALIATVLNSKLWRIALPVTLLMFLFVTYVMGT